jgi:hypothetical protein
MTMVKRCLYERQFTDGQGGREVGIARLKNGLRFALSEAEKWLVEQSPRPCTAKCWTIALLESTNDDTTTAVY